MRLTSFLRVSIKNLPRTWSNFPERYIRRQTEFKLYETPRLPNYQRKIERWRNNAYYDIYEPWTDEFQHHNGPNQFQPRIYVEPYKYFPVFTGDLVEILDGKDKGKQGTVTFVVARRNWVFVDKLNLGYMIQGATATTPGNVYAESLPLLLNRDVQLIDPSDKKPTRVEWRYDEEGNEVRVSTRTGRIIVIPEQAEETYDYKAKEHYVEQPKDTSAKDLKEITFVPKAVTFEMDIMEEMGVKEDRVPYPMYWY